MNTEAYLNKRHPTLLGKIKSAIMSDNEDQFFTALSNLMPTDSLSPETRKTIWKAIHDGDAATADKYLLR